MKARGASKALAVLVFTAAGAWGCNAVLGVGDYAADLGGTGGTGTGGTGFGGTSPFGGTSGAGGAHTGGKAGAATGGTAGSGGTAGAGGNAAGGTPGVGGSSGHGGVGTGGGGTSAGSGGSAGAGAGTGGSAGTGGAATCGAGLAPDPAVVRACVLDRGCDPFVPSATIGNCITYNSPQSDHSWVCKKDALTCMDMQKCSGRFTVPATPCAGKTGVQVCNGVKGVTCFSDGTAAEFVDCSLRGGTCQTYIDSATGTQLAGCQVKATCTEKDEGTDNGHCDASGTYYQCLGGIGFGSVCKLAQASCKGDGANAGCYFDYPGCTDTSMESCVGADVLSCDEFDLGYTYRCGAAGTACTPVMSGGTTDYYCLAPNCTVTDANACVESCAGTVANVCVGGAQLPIDCVKAGFSQCVTSMLPNKSVAAICF